MQLEDLATALGEAATLKQANLDLKRELDKVKTISRDNERRARDAEREVKALLKKDKSRLTADQEAWLFERNATVTWSSTAQGKLKVSIKTRRVRGVQLFFDPALKGPRPLRDVIEAAQKAAR